MATIDSTGDREGHPKGPNFGVVVIAATVALFLAFIVALVILAVRGKKDLPLNHTHKERNARIDWPTGPATHANHPDQRIDVTVYRNG